MAEQRAKPPVLPRSKRDPTGADALERAAMRDFNKRMKKIGRGYVKILGRVPATPVVNARYEFRLDAVSLLMWLSEGDLLVDLMLMEGGLEDLWFYRSYVSVAAARGTAQEFANLSRQSEAYKAARGSAQALLNTPEYRRRAALLAAREFEEMKGLAGGVKADMARILTDGMARGQNPRTIARTLMDQVGIESRRAHKIARTEINTALRRARMDEADEASEELNLKSMEMHYSALSPTTRASHAARHGNLYTTDQQRDWWSRDANSINCKCTSITVLVDANGKPLVPEIQKRAREARRRQMEEEEVD